MSSTLSQQIFPHIFHGAFVMTTYSRTNYVDLLLLPSRLSVKQPLETVGFKSLIRLDQLDRRGCTTLVHTSSEPLSQYVFKGIDFRTFLNTFESRKWKSSIDQWNWLAICPAIPTLRASRRNWPLFANLVTTCRSCVGISIPNGSLASHIEKNNESSDRLPMPCKAQWCYWMAAAIAHTHFVART